MIEDRSGTHPLGPQMPQRARHVAIAPRVLPEVGGIDLEFDQMLHGPEHVAKEEARTLERAEEVRRHREAATPDAREEERRAARLVNSALDLRRFQVWV